ncbi:MAG: hypothetical protein LZT29_04391 (plasmid) [Pantoea stewartii]|uniref:putative hemolysin n=1 Tax=Pantoea TaxID=53335 RepID=UPI000542768D|nr:MULTISPECIES: DUF333 domain-containing protein [Pantoea]KHE01126.1 hemolysin [Pantoea stewartii]KHN63421.1 hemolysin [Pantoea stewartii]NRH24945.1 hemolysin [Pantoea stewartii]UYK99665.1 DUF333 domain-containing protein [Pantoea stewartii]WHT01241.1 MAG: hypothetical protein LZT29_04391 [Pantoea stewartii]
MRQFLLVLTSILVVGCAPDHRTRTSGLANPASQHCLAVGGKSDIVKTPTGEVGYCTLPSGEHIEEWTLYRRDASKG